MSRPRIDQLLAGFADGDAISQEARLFRDSLRSIGVESEIFAPPERVSPSLAGSFQPLDRFESRQRDGVIHHYSIQSEATRLFLGAGCRRWVRYHNISPAGDFDGFDDAVAEQLRSARAGLDDVVRAADGVWAASEYNAAEVRSVAGGKAVVLPLAFSFDEFMAEPDPAALDRFGGDAVNWLFMGRMAPNKCVEELILAFAWYHRTMNPFSRLLLLGSERSCPRYYAMLKLLAARLGLRNVCFEGFVPGPVRSACFMRAHVFVTASRHEGYCLPIVEAMSRNVPVLARNAGGMPEAMDGAGIMFDDAGPRELAALAHAAAADLGLRGRILAAQAARMERLRARDLNSELARLTGLPAAG
ncbi:MAG: glycosyltransferase family 4 protein [Lentisphaerae bacterium]|nr:glycosyltransferase family 4 protein [Lentisphaerota bacterium]